MEAFLFSEACLLFYLHLIHVAISIELLDLISTLEIESTQRHEEPDKSCFTQVKKNERIIIIIIITIQFRQKKIQGYRMMIKGFSNKQWNGWALYHTGP